MPFFNIVAQMKESTVVAEYEPTPRKAEAYQSEAELEREFMHLLNEQGYEDKPIHSESELVDNLREKLQRLNGYTFTDSEWKRFFSECISNANEGIVEKTRRIQEDHVQVLRRDDGTSRNILLIDKKNVHNNSLQVINQYTVSRDDGARHDNRYDVTVLVNGLPLVHIELKRRGVALREAFNQIERYQRDSFFAGSGLFEYVQIFVISNGTNTKYYSNTTRYSAIKELGSSGPRKGKTSNSFEFTSFWADARNRVLPDLIDFTKTFFAKHTLLNILTKYCVFTSENLLLVMRTQSSRLCYHSMMVNKIIAPYFRKRGIKLVDLTPKHIQDFYLSELERVSANTVIHYHANIHKALKYAVKLDLIPTNPADKIERPKKGAFKGSFYDSDEIKKLLEVSKGTKFEIPVMLAAFYGLRRSEVLGLKWDAVDFDKNTITIRHTLSSCNLDGKHIIVREDRTKTKSSMRTLPLVDFVKEKLIAVKAEQEKYRKLCGRSYMKDYIGYICVNEIGDIIKPRYLTVEFPKLLEKHGLRRIRFHDLRHSCASLLLANGVSMKQIQEWLGHSDFSTTANVYAHLDYSSKMSSADALLGGLGIT